MFRKLQGGAKMSNDVTAVYVYSDPPTALLSAVRQAIVEK